VTVYFNDSVAGSGDHDFGGGIRVNFALAHVSAQGSRVRVAQTSDQTLGAGWIAFGAAADLIDGVTRVYWNEPIWINWENTQWHPIPTTDYLANDFGVWVSHIRWWFSLDTEVSLYVYGV
jgi:hypothetical protein